MWDTSDDRTLRPHPLRHNVARSLDAIEPSVDGQIRYYPCSVTLDDGAVYPRTILIEAQSFARHWGVWPWGDKCLAAENICSLSATPYRLPAVYANVLYVAGESGMGYCSFSVTFSDGRKLYYVTGNSVDFPAWPNDVDLHQIRSVQPHDHYPKHRSRMPTANESSADFKWCPYTLEENQRSLCMKQFKSVLSG